MKEPIIRSQDCNPESNTFGKVLDYDNKWKKQKDLMELKTNG